MDFWRADIQQILETTIDPGACPNDQRQHLDSTQQQASREESRRALQQWLYESYNEGAFVSDKLLCEQRLLEHAAQELCSVRTVALCNLEREKRLDLRAVSGKSSLELQWICQYALVKQHLLSLQERQRFLDQGRDLREVMSLLEHALDHAS